MCPRVNELAERGRMVKGRTWEVTGPVIYQSQGSAHWLATTYRIEALAKAFCDLFMFLKYGNAICLSCATSMLIQPPFLLLPHSGCFSCSLLIPPAYPFT